MDCTRIMDWKYVVLAVLVTQAAGAKLGKVKIEELEGYVQRLTAAKLPEVAPREDVNKPNTDPFTFDDIFSGEFSPKSFSSQWFQDHTLVYRDSDGNLVQHNPETGDIQTLLSNNTFELYNSGTYFVSSDLTHVLLASNVTQVWRHSYTATYVIVTVGNEAEVNPVAGGAVLQYAAWAPTGTGLTYVHENDLYYQANVGDTSGDPVTDDGDVITRFNGIPNWLYEEDVISSRVAHYFSPDGAHVCYATFDDVTSQSIRYEFYGDKSNVYPQTVDIRYPKAGGVSPITVVNLTVVAVSDVTTKIALEPPADLVGVDHYFTRVTWLNDVTIQVTWTNRVQTVAYVMTYDVTDTSDVISALSYNLTVDNGWIDSPYHPPVPDTTGDYYAAVHPRTIETGDTWNHVAWFTTGQGNPLFLSTGEHEVMSVVAVDAERVYYLSTGGDPKNRHLFYNNLTEPLDEVGECLTCHLEETECAYVSASMSPDSMYYMLTCSGPGVPTYTLYNTSTNQPVAVFEDNAALKTRLETKAIATREFIELDLGEGYVGDAEVFIPPNRVEGETHPLLVYAYGGPGSQRVLRTFPMGSYINNWLMYLKSTHRVVVASVDSRGASGKGQEFRYLLYKKLGTVEVWDQMLAAQQLLTRGEVNSEANAAVFGWSYGGLVSALSLANDSSPYQCGISVAPVTTKRYYDTAYTERYMGLDTEDDNSAGYDNTDVMSHAALFTNKTYLIAHGTDDDNVHFQHFAQLVKALVEQEVQFRQMVYVDENHSIASLSASRHLFRGLTNFLLQDCGWDSLGDDTGEGGEGGEGCETDGAISAQSTSVTLLLVTMVTAAMSTRY